MIKQQKNKTRDSWAIVSGFVTALTILLQYIKNVFYLSTEEFFIITLVVAVVAVVAVVVSVIALVKAHRWWKLLFASFVVIGVVIATTSVFTASLINS